MRANSHLVRFAPGLPLALILLLSYALRVYQLGAQSLGYDEALGVLTARQDLPELIPSITGGLHAPLYYVGLHYWLLLTGNSEFATGYVSVFFGVLLVALVFRVAGGWFGSNTGVMAAFLAAISVFNLWSSQEVQMHTLAGFLALLSLVWLAKLWDFQLRIWPAHWRQVRGLLAGGAYALTVALGLYTHYHFVFLWVFQYVVGVAHLLWRWQRNGRPWQRSLSPELAALRDWHLIQLAIIGLLAPWLPVALRQVTAPPATLAPFYVTARQAVFETLRTLVFGQSQRIEITWPLVLIALTIYVLALTVTYSRLRTGHGREAGIRTPLFLLGSTFAPLALMLLVSPFAQVYDVRHMFIYAAAFYIVLALGFHLIAQRSLILMVVLLGFYTGGALYTDLARRANPAFAKDDYRGAVRFIAERMRPGDAVLINAGYVYPVFVYYYSEPVEWSGRLTDFGSGDGASGLVVAQTGSIGASLHAGWDVPPSDFYATDEADTSRALDLLLMGHPRLWVLRANDSQSDPQGFIRQYLASHAIQFDEFSARGESGVKAQGFLARGFSAADAVPVNITMGERITLMGWAGATTASAGSPLKLTLFWKPIAPSDVNYRATLGLFDGRGHQWALADGLPVSLLLPTSAWPIGQTLPDVWSLAIPLGTPPGDYSLQVGLYDPVSKKEVPVPSGADGVHAGLGRIRVVRPEGPSASGSLADNLLNTKSVFEDGIELASFSVSPERVRPGEIIHTELMWHALNTPLEDDVVFLQLLDERGRLVAAQESPPLDGRYPTSQWVAGEYVRDPRDLRVPTNVPDGQYRLITGLYRASDQARLNASPRGLPFGSDSVQLRALEVKGRQRVMKAPASLGTPAQVRFGSGALLIGYDVQGLTPSLAASRNLTVTLYWQAVAPMQTAYKVFMHVVGANGQIVGQRDSEPGAGTLPTTGWLEGEYLTDSYVLEVKAGAPPGDYSLYMGWYDPDTGVRLTIYDADGKIIGDRWLARRWTW